MVSRALDRRRGRHDPLAFVVLADPELALLTLVVLLGFAGLVIDRLLVGITGQPMSWNSWLFGPPAGNATNPFESPIGSSPPK